MIINSLEDFKESLSKFVEEDDLFEFQSNQQIKIEETQKDGKGEVYLIVNCDSFQIKPSSKLTIKNNSHNDGIVLVTDIKNKKIDIHLFELKKQLRWRKLEKAVKQLYNAYIFIKYLNLEECFNVNYYLYIAVKENSLLNDYEELKNSRGYNFKLFESVYENKNTLPLMLPFCKYKEFNFKLVNFGDVINVYVKDENGGS